MTDSSVSASAPSEADAFAGPADSVWARITPDAIVPDELLGRVGAPEDGATLLFLGVVRNHHGGRSVSGLHYEAYEEMAQAMLDRIAREGARILGTDRVAVVHRVGDLEVGEVSVAIAVSSPHRAEAYRASRYVMEEIKKRLPIWKKEHYVEGESSWLQGTRPTPGGDAEEGTS